MKYWFQRKADREFRVLRSQLGYKLSDTSCLGQIHSKLLKLFPLPSMYVFCPVNSSS